MKVDGGGGATTEAAGQAVPAGTTTEQVSLKVSK